MGVRIVTNRCLKCCLSPRVFDAENGKRTGEGCMMLRLYCRNVGSGLKNELLSIFSMACNVNSLQFTVHTKFSMVCTVK